MAVVFTSDRMRNSDIYIIEYFNASSQHLELVVFIWSIKL